MNRDASGTSQGSTGYTGELGTALAGRYRLDRQLGAGGMATVYLAQDLKHDRPVALKVLKPELAAVLGADRFLAEIRTTANLQHPHVLPLFESGQVAGTVFYVMPYVEGESLRDRLTRDKQLSIDDALRIAREVGDALQYAHSHGVIHRDIKPENILLQGGHALVADFGIALAAANTGGTRMTETGMSLGTPRYMSPEQAMGERALDPRTDVYALGCVLYEMLTGDPPFTGSTAQAIVAKVLTEKPASIVARRDRVPPQVESAVLTALEKLPADRFTSAADFIAALRGEATAATTASRTAGRARARAISPRSMMLVGAAFLVVGGVAGWLLGRSGARVSAPASRLMLVEPGMGPAFSGVSRAIDISRDGQSIAYTARHPTGTRILIRRLDGTAPAELQVANGFQLKFSRDARSLYMSQGGTMQRIPLPSGAATTLSGVESTPFIEFAEDGTMWWASGLQYATYRRGVDGRDSIVLPAAAITHLLPGDGRALGVRSTTGSNSGTPVLIDLRTGAERTLFDAPTVEVKYTAGYLVYVRPDGALVAAPFDLGSEAITGGHVEIAKDVSVSGVGFAQYAVSDNGTVAYVPGFNNDLVRLSRSGELRVLLPELRRYHSPRIAPDGRRIAFDDVTGEGRDVWIATVGSRDVTRATFQKDGHDPSWSLDGRSIFYLGGRGGRLDVFRAQLGSTSPPTPLDVKGELAYTGTPLANGELLTDVNVPGRKLDAVRFRPGAAPDTVLGSPADESYVVPSPNGRWFAYVSDRSGRSEVYVSAMRGSDVLLQVSLEGASEPMWSRDGRELFYRRAIASGAELVAARLELGAEPRVLSRSALFDVSNFDTAAPHSNYDVSPDGSWFVFSRRVGSDHVVVLQNIPDLVRRISRSGAP